MTPLFASLFIMGLGATLGQAHAQTINLTSANPSFDIGSTTYSIVGITVGNGVNGMITGAGGSLDYTGASTPFALGGSSNGQAQSLNMSGLTHFVFNNPTLGFSVSGNVVGGTGTGDTSGTMTLAAASNTIASASFGVGNVDRSISATASNIGTLYLGQTNTIDADTITIGNNQATGILSFSSGISGGNLILRGTDGVSPVGTWNIGTGTSSNYRGSTGAVDLSAGSLDAQVTNLVIGQAQYGSQSAAGALRLGSGTLNASSIMLGQRDSVSGGGTGGASGTLIIGSATVTTQTLTIGNRTGSTGSATGIVNLDGGGILRAQTIQSGSGTATRTFNWTDGTLGNYANGQDMTVSIPTLTLLGTGTHAFDIEGGNAVANVSSVVSGNGAVLTKEGDGILALSGANTYSGGTLVIGGLVNFASLSNLGTGNVTLNGGGLQWASGNTVDVSAQLNPLGANGAVFDTNGNDVALAGNLTGSGGVLIKQGAGTLTLTGTNSYDGGTQISAGTLQIGSGGTSGSVVGDVIDNGTLAFDRSDAVTFGGAISGNGEVSQLGPDTLTFIADNTYTGGTTIAGGTLQLGNGGTSGSIVGNVTNNGVLAFDRSDAMTLSGVISGTGAVQQLGAGTTILAADNTYTGGTTISAGTLQLGNGGTTGSVVGPIVDNGSLAVDRSDTVTLPFVISGTGSLMQAGTGTTILTADNTYAGGTTIAAGTLQLGDGGTTGSVVGPIVDNGSLAIDHSDTVTLPLVISGTGSLIQAGTGTTILTANEAYTGSTMITAGTLQLGNGGTSGSVAGNIVDNAALMIDRSGDVTLANLVSGNGTLTKLGTNTLTLTGNDTYTGLTTIAGGVLQIGDGGTSGAIVGATVDNGTLQFNRSDSLTYAGAISGGGLVRQVGTGTTELSGANSYTGGTFINAGTLSVAADANLGDPAGAVHLDGGTLQLSVGFNTARSLLLDGAGGTLATTNLNTFSGTVSGGGTLTKTGDGAAVFNAPAGNQVGAVHVAAGTLAVGDGFHTAAQLTSSGGFVIDAGASFGGYGQVTGDVHNAGTLGVGNALAVFANGPDATFTINGELVNTGDVTLANGFAGDQLIVNGNYVANGGHLLIDAVLNQGGAAAQADRLVANTVTVAGQPTGIIVDNVGGTGAITTGDGIPLVHVLDPAASAAGAFVLANRVVEGPYEYFLFQGGVTNPADGQWYLRNEEVVNTPEGPVVEPILRPEVGAYLANREALSDMLVLTLHDRQGDPQYASDAADPDSAMGKMWFRIQGGSTQNTDADGLVHARGQRALFQLGGDFGAWNLTSTDDRIHLGGMFGHGNANADTTALLNPSQAQGHANGNFGGIYATWFADDKQRLGSYVDTWVQYGWFDNDVSSDRLPAVDYHSHMWATSLEYGYGIGLGPNWLVEPAAQVVYTDYHARTLSDGSGTVVRSLDNGNTQGRIGVRLYPQLNSAYPIHPFVEVDWWHGGGNAKVSFNGLPLADGVPNNRYQVNAGFQGAIARGLVIWARIGGSWGNGSYRRNEAVFGLKYSWR